jgi:hypothetical protein
MWGAALALAFASSRYEPTAAGVSRAIDTPNALASDSEISAFHILSHERVVGMSEAGLFVADPGNGEEVLLSVHGDPSPKESCLR